MPTDISGLLTQWKIAANDLGIEIEAPFDLMLPSGVHLQVPILVRHFGASKGMLVVSDYALVKNLTDEIVRAGYGYSTMDEPRKGEEYTREIFIEVLADWGWHNEKFDKPGWLK